MMAKRQLGKDRPAVSKGCLSIVIVIAGLILAGQVVSHLTGSSGSFGSSGPAVNLPTGTPSVRPTNDHPPVWSDPSIVEAIDLPDQPTPGQTWDASGGPVNDGLERSVYVTPCGVLVTVTAPGFFSPTVPEAAIPSVTGYDIASGAQLWRHSLVDVSGLAVPMVNLTANPTFTSDCHMVLNLMDTSGSGFSLNDATAVLDLKTGEAQTIKPGHLSECAAAGNGWMGCWNTDADGHSNGIQPVDLGDPKASPRWYDSAYVSLSRSGSPVAVGDIWTPGGYRDPSTGWVVFGADTYVNNPWKTPQKNDVFYVEPQRPGSFPSGLVVRATGNLEADAATCLVTLWDPQTDRAAWENPVSVICGGARTTTKWVVADGVLIVSSDTYDANYKSTFSTSAFALVDGKALWQSQAALGGTKWDAGMAYTEAPRGISTNYVVGQTNPYLAGGTTEMVRLADGAKLHVSGFKPAAVADTMVYSVQSGKDGGMQFAAYNLDTSTGRTTPAWALPIDRSDTDTLIHWTFVTDGQMYLVGTNTTSGQVTVTPLLTG